MSLLREIGLFLLAVVNNWAGYSTGGVIVAVVALWHLIREKPVPRKLGIGLAIFFFVLSFFKAWQDQYEHAAALQSQSNQKPFTPQIQVNTPPAQVVINPPPTTATPFPCDHAMKFSQTESADGAGLNPFRQRVTIVPGKIIPESNADIIIRFYATGKIASGFSEGVSVASVKGVQIGDALAAGIDTIVGNMGLAVQNNEIAELWIKDQSKFSEAKSVTVDLMGPERFKIICVQQLVMQSIYERVPVGQ